MEVLASSSQNATEKTNYCEQAVNACWVGLVQCTSVHKPGDDSTTKELL